MNGHSAVLSWLGQSLAIGGGLLMLAAALMALVRQPVRRRMIGATAVRIALLAPLLALGPKWLLIPVPETTAAPSVVNNLPQVRQQEQLADVPANQPVADPAAGELAFIFVPSPSEPVPAASPMPPAPAVEAPTAVAPVAQPQA